MTIPLRMIRTIGAVLGFVVVLYAMLYLRPGMPAGFEQQLDVYRDRAFLFYLHIGGGMVALAGTPFQLWARVRDRHPRYHRIAGRVIATAIVLGSIGGLGMSFTAYGGVPNRIGFATLAVLWASTVLLAVRAIRAGDVAQHRRWMIRAASLTFAAVTLRLWLGGLTPLVGFEPTYAVLGWLSWVPNLLVAEWWLRSTSVGEAAAVQDEREVRQRRGGLEAGSPAVGVGDEPVGQG
jgi:uncharacterized membrane protein